MTLAGLSLAIRPMVDSAIICLENTHTATSASATSRRRRRLRRKRGRDAGAGRELLHALVLALRRVPASASSCFGRWRCSRLRHDLRVHLVALAGAGPVRPVASWTSGPRASANDRWIAGSPSDAGRLARSRHRPLHPFADGADEPAALDCRRRGRAARRRRRGARLPASPRVLSRGRRRRLRDLRPRQNRHAHRGDGEADRRRRGDREGDGRQRPRDTHQRDRRRRGLVGRLHAERGADGFGREGPALPRADPFRPGVRREAAERLRGGQSIRGARVPSTPAA